MTSKPIRILKAIKLFPRGHQPGLRPVRLLGQLEVDPLRDDLAVKLVELRSSVKATNPKLAAGLKTAAKGAAFGIPLPVKRKGFGFFLALASVFW